MGKRIGRAVLVLLLLFASVYSIAGNARAQIADPGAVADRKAQLQAQLDQLEQEISGQEQILHQKQQETASLQRDVDILNAKIKSAKLSIKAQDVSIQQLSQEIGQKETTITGLSEKLYREKQSLARLLRRTSELDRNPYIAVILGNGTLSDVFAELEDFHNVQQSLNNSFAEIEGTKTATKAQEDALQEKKNEQVQLRQLQVLEEKKIEDQEAERKRILAVSKGEESIYQQVIASKQKTAAQIRTELFTLSGSAAIPFEKALQYANEVGKATGVRPAFILGIIAEESNLGANVGTGSWRVDMNPTRDQPIFLQITKELGLDPDKMPVSKKPWYGWGGAMGPAQFIPSTWILYQDRIAQATGSNPPNPWAPKDAFAAAAILLADNGATKQTPQAERLAALRYLAGWKNATKPAYSFYGDDVMELADKYQDQINILLAGRAPALQASAIPGTIAAR